MLQSSRQSFNKTLFFYLLFYKYPSNLIYTNIFNKFLFFKYIFIFFHFKPLKYFKQYKADIFNIVKLKSISYWPFDDESVQFALYNTSIRKSIYGGYKGYHRVKHFTKLLSSFKYLKSLRPILRRFNFLKYINFYKYINTLKKKKNYFSLKNRIFLNKKTIQKSIVTFFYKKVKFKVTKSDLKKNHINNILEKSLPQLPLQTASKLFSNKNPSSLIFLNLYKKFYWKIRKSRITHWDSLVGNRLNKYRYAKFIKKTMRIKNNLSPNNLYILFISHLSGLVCSWRQIYLLITFNLIVLNGSYYPTTKFLKRGDIIEVCYGRGLEKNFKIQSYFNFKIYYRLKRWGYRNRLNYELPKKKRIFKKVPKSIKSLLASYKNSGRSFMYLKTIGLAAVIYKIPTHLYEPTELLYKTSILKLNHWRYKF